MLLRQPSRRARRRSLHDDRNSLIAALVHYFAEKRKIELAFLGLHCRPCELGNADAVKSQGLHKRKVLVDEIAVPRLGIVIGAENGLFDFKHKTYFLLHSIVIQSILFNYK